MRSKHPNLEIAAVTVVDNEALIRTWKDAVGADLPILRGVSTATAEAYGVRGYPTFRVLGPDGRVLGSDQATLDAQLSK